MSSTKKSNRRLARGSRNHIGRDFDPLNQFFHRRIFEELKDRGFGDLREGHQAIFIHIEDEGSTLTELAAKAKLSKQALHQLVNDLEARGYVERVPSPDDGRAKLIRTTDKGERSIETAWSAIAQIEREWTAVLGAAKMHAFREMLAALRRRAEVPSSARTASTTKTSAAARRGVRSSK